MAYNRVKQLNGRSLDSALKHGATRDDLCREYGCTGAQLDRQISQIYNNKFVKLQEIWRTLRDNDRKRAIEVSEDTERLLAMAPEMARRHSLEEESDDTDTAGDASKSDETQHALEARVKSLSEEGDRLMEEVKVYDEQIGKAQEQYDACQVHVDEAVARVEASETKIAEAQKELAQRQRKFEELCGIAEEKFGVLERLKALRQIKLAEVERVRDQIWDLTQVTLGVDIEVEEIMVIDSPAQCQVKINASGADEIFDVLIQQQGCEDFKLKELRLLATTIAVAHNLNAKVKLMCDDTEFCRAFEEFA